MLSDLANRPSISLVHVYIYVWCVYIIVCIFVKFHHANKAHFVHIIVCLPGLLTNRYQYMESESMELDVRKHN